jgi:hypothetical protein
LKKRGAEDNIKTNLKVPNKLVVADSDHLIVDEVLLNAVKTSESTTYGECFEQLKSFVAVSYELFEEE